jgi:hypothetical protein
MDRQKILIGVLSGVLTVSVLIFAYQRMMNSTDTDTGIETPQAMMEKKEAPKPIPTTPSGIVDEIEGEAALDATALDAEIDAETAEIQKESESLNNLSQSYDENQI